MTTKTSFLHANESNARDKSLSDAVELYEAAGLYLKPIARMNVCVTLPQIKCPDKTISNWEVMEKLRFLVMPDAFNVIKVIKSTLEFIRFEAEVENKSMIKVLIMRLDGKFISLGGFVETLKVKAAEAKISFPVRYDWDVYFRDAKHMNEMKPGERPDTIHIKELPIRWFALKNSQGEKAPDEGVVRKVFETFGTIRCIDIPVLDPYRKEMTCSNVSHTFSYGQELVFEAFIQYSEYVSFDKAMNAFRGMKLICTEGENSLLTASIKVDFDRTRHLSDKMIKKRRNERQKLEQLEKEREERVLRERREEEERREIERHAREIEEEEKERKRKEKLYRQKCRRESREEKRRQKWLRKQRLKEEREMKRRIEMEERRILIAQRKLESIHLMSELINRVKVVQTKKDLKLREEEAEREKIRQVEAEKRAKIQAEQQKILREMKKRQKLEKQEKDLRSKMLHKFKLAEDKKSERQREDLRRKLSGTLRLKSHVALNPEKVKKL